MIQARLGEVVTYDDLEYEILEHEGVRIQMSLGSNFAQRL